MTLSSDDFIDLSDPEEEIVTPETEEEKYSKFIQVITNEPNRVEIVTNCESCDEPLRVPVMMIFSSEDARRDSSILCDAKCTE